MIATRGGAVVRSGGHARDGTAIAALKNLALEDPNLDSDDSVFRLRFCETKYGIIGIKCWIFKGEVLQRRVRRPIAGSI